MSSWNVLHRSRSAVFTFGRFNPPTIGHQKMLQKILSIAEQEGSDPYLFLSHTQDKKKNPLSYEQKLEYMEDMFPEMKEFMLPREVIKTPIGAALYLNVYDKITIVVGSDRVDGFKTMLERYNGKEMKTGMYSYKEINVISAGERDPDAEGIEGMSASKMRLAAKLDDLETFQSGLPENYNGKDLMDVVKSQLN